MNEDPIEKALRQAYRAEGFDTAQPTDISGVMRRAHHEAGVADLLVLGFTRIFQSFFVVFSSLYSQDSGSRSDEQS